MMQAPRTLKEARFPRTLKEAFGPYAELEKYIEPPHWTLRPMVFLPVVGAVAVVLYVLLYVAMAVA